MRLLQTQATLCRFLYLAGSTSVTHLYYISSCTSSTLATDELNSVQFREAKNIIPFFLYAHAFKGM